MAPITIKRTTVLIIEVNTRFIPFFSRKLENGIINEASNMPKRNGFKNGAPKYKAAKVNTTKISILLIVVNLCMVCLFYIVVNFSEKRFYVKFKGKL